MVTSNGAKAAGVTAAAIVGLLVGFYVQDIVRERRRNRMESRVEAEVARRKGVMAAADAPVASPPTVPAAR